MLRLLLLLFYLVKSRTRYHVILRLQGAQRPMILSVNRVSAHRVRLELVCQLLLRKVTSEEHC